jgi:2-oxoglutarate dehydrogenase complex dehydrogenase (E1) component-like enzyme
MFLKNIREIDVVLISNFSFFSNSYVGRGVSASPATGSKRQHLKEAAQLLEDAFAGL